MKTIIFGLLIFLGVNPIIAQAEMIPANLRIGLNYRFRGPVPKNDLSTELRSSNRTPTVCSDFMMGSETIKTDPLVPGKEYDGILTFVIQNNCKPNKEYPLSFKLKVSLDSDIDEADDVSVGIEAISTSKVLKSLQGKHKDKYYLFDKKPNGNESEITILKKSILKIITDAFLNVDNVKINFKKSSGTFSYITSPVEEIKKIDAYAKSVVFGVFLRRGFIFKKTKFDLVSNLSEKDFSFKQSSKGELMLNMKKNTKLLNIKPGSYKVYFTALVGSSDTYITGLSDSQVKFIENLNKGKLSPKIYISGDLKLDP